MFTCVVNNLGGHRKSPSSAQVAWIKSDTKAILAIHQHVITNNARLSVTHNDVNTWTLNIRNVQREDQGTYMCQVNTDPMKSQTAFLEVVIPPDIVYEETSGDTMTPEGGNLKLRCRARGYPPPRIVWKREDGGEIVVRNDSTGSKTRKHAVEGEDLVLHKVTRSEMGVYVCIASNGVPPPVSKRLMLFVNFHPLIQVPNQLVGAPVATDVTIQCIVEACPKAINYWTREKGEMIINNDKYQMDESPQSAYGVLMKLTVRKFRKADIGAYKCISKNSIGDAEGIVRLYELTLPRRKSLELDPEQQLSDAHLQDTLPEDAEEALDEEDAEAPSPDEASGTSASSSATSTATPVRGGLAALLMLVLLTPLRHF
ncbi:lachesin [Thrips palmi]|uniref:Lachesin n=1 Tax=Thrips palmi TaxID=161013 RepID=A0A6P8Z513_THRPL|nr:lachesin [Thrips palmi]